MGFMKLFHRRLPFRLPVLAAFSALLYAGHALAIEPFTVKDIRVEGIQRTEAGTVFNYLPVRVGDTFNDEKAVTAIRSLYATGFFKDVRIDAEGDILVVIVEERPAIASVEFTGTKEFDKDMLVKSMKDVGLGEARIYDRALLDRAEQELKRQYMSRGLYDIKITTTVTPVERNRVAINFTVDEGQASRIKEIKFVGNKAYSDKEPLAKLLFLPEDTELALRTSAGRMLLVNTAQIAAKTTRDSQGVAVVTLKKNQTIASVVPAETLELANPHRYRVRSLPDTGALIRAEDEGEQLTML